MNNILIIVFLIIVVFILLGILFLINSQLKKKKRHGLITKYKEEYEEAEHTFARLLTELERTEKISKNEESINLYNSWLDQYRQLKARKDKLDLMFPNLSSLDNGKDHKQFMNEAAEVDTLIYEFEEDVYNLYKKVKQFTNYELENTRISLTLKQRIKELNVTFERELAILGIYNSSFDERIRISNEGIADFEQKQHDGQYPEGREILKNCNRVIDDVEMLLNLLLQLNQYLEDLASDVQMMRTVQAEINELGYSLNIDNFDNVLDNFARKLNELQETIAAIDFIKGITKEEQEEIEKILYLLDQEIGEFKVIIEERFSYVKKFIDIIEENNKLLVEANELIVGAIKEKEEIISLYQLPEVKQIKRLDDELEIYKSFIKDYQKLLEIVYDAREDFSKINGRLEKSNKYLRRLLVNIRAAILQLHNIRTDEIEIREKFEDYKRRYIQIMLYLVEVDHLDNKGNVLDNQLKELYIKLQELEKELNSEPLHIGNVRLINNSVDKVLNTSLEKVIEKDVKQRLGAKKLIEYISLYNDNSETNLVIKRMLNNYRAANYLQILREAKEVLEQRFGPAAEATYKRVVGEVEILEIKDFLKMENARLQKHLDLEDFAPSSEQKDDPIGM